MKSFRATDRFRGLVLCVALGFALPLFLTAPAGIGQTGPARYHADLARSDFRLELGKTGFLKAFGDDHLIRVTDYQCNVILNEQDLLQSSLRLTIPTNSLQVLDPGMQAGKRAEVQSRMQGPEVLDVAHYPEITFVSQRLTALGATRFQVEGDLKIRGVTKRVAMDVALTRVDSFWRVQGEARVRQTLFGIKPVSAGGGSVKVKDEMRIVFNLVLVPARS